MAGTTTKSRRTQRKGSDVNDLIIEYNKLVDDAETLRSALSSGGVVAVTELMADHATFKVTVDQLETLAEELAADHATGITWDTEVDADLDNIGNQLDSVLTPDGVIGGSYVIGPVATAATLPLSGWIKYQIGGVVYTAQVPATVTLAAQTISQNNFGAWRIEIDRLGAVTATSGATAAGYSSAQIALLALAAVAPTANTATIGYFTATDSDSTYVVGTNNLDAAGMTVVFYYERAPRKRISGLNAALGAASTLTAASTTFGHGTINVNVNGLKKAQIAAGAAQALTDANTIDTLKWGNVVLMTNLAGTGYVSLNDTGVPGTGAMSNASAAAALTASDLVIDRLPSMFVPFALIKVNNQSGASFTFKTDNWDAASVTSTITDATVGGWNRTVATGFDSHQISRAAIPASITAPLVATLSATTAITSGPATLSASVPTSTVVDTAADMTAAKIGNTAGTAITV